MRQREALPEINAHDLTVRADADRGLEIARTGGDNAGRDVTGELIDGLSQSVEVSLLIGELSHQRSGEKLSAVRMAGEYQIRITCCGLRDSVRVVVQHQEIIILPGETGGGRIRQRGRRTISGDFAAAAGCLAIAAGNLAAAVRNNAAAADGSGPDACLIQELGQRHTRLIPRKPGTSGQKEGAVSRCLRVGGGL